jgi:hypothetical protein
MDLVLQVRTVTPTDWTKEMRVAVAAVSSYEMISPSLPPYHLPSTLTIRITVTLPWRRLKVSLVSSLGFTVARLHHLTPCFL